MSDEKSPPSCAGVFLGQGLVYRSLWFSAPHYHLIAGVGPSNLFPLATPLSNTRLQIYNLFKMNPIRQHLGSQKLRTY